MISKLPSSTLHKLEHATIARYTQVDAMPVTLALRQCRSSSRRTCRSTSVQVTVVGSAIFAAEILPAHVSHKRLAALRPGETPYLPHGSPRRSPTAHRDCSASLCATAPSTGAHPDDRYVFLEINPNGQYLWIEHSAGCLGGAVCDLLQIADGSVMLRAGCGGYAMNDLPDLDAVLGVRSRTCGGSRTRVSGRTRHLRSVCPGKAPSQHTWIWSGSRSPTISQSTTTPSFISRVLGPSH